MLDKIAKIFGTKADKDVKLLQPYVALVNTEFDKLATITDDELRGKTAELKDRIATHLKTIDYEITNLSKQVESQDLDVNQKEDLFAQIDKLEEDRDVELEKVLMEILPEAFAVVKETARRFSENSSG